MSPLTHITVPIELYTDKNLCEVKRAILGLTLAFGDGGLGVSDSNLAAIFGKTRQWINEVISKLCKDGYIKIDNPRSKYRVLYCQGKLTGMGNESTGVDRNESTTVDRNTPPAPNESTPAPKRVNSSPQTSQLQLTHKLKEKKEAAAPLAATAVVEYWNTKANLPTVRQLTPDRQAKLKTRRREPLFAENWQQIIDKLAASAFCCGRNDRSWKADLDWILKDSTNYTKVLEGKYDNETPQSGEPDYGPALDKLTAPLSPEKEAELVKAGVI